MLKRLRSESLNDILAMGAVLVLFLVLGIKYDFYYEFNDDVLIKDIISGRYTGNGDGHSVQMLYLLGEFLAMLYNVMPRIPWFALFLYVCFGFGLYLIIKRSIMFCRFWWTKAFVVALEIFMTVILMLWELVFVQYTVVCGFLVATALFMFYTTPNGLSVKEFWRMNVGSVFLIIVAFFVRTEMMLLMSPFIAAAGILHWSNENHFFCKKNFQKYLTIIGAVLVGCFVGIIGDRIAYSSDAWKEFLTFFNARTQVYDYTWYPQYDKAEAYYNNAGISKVQYQLIDTYNYSLDESIDTELLEQIASYGEKQRNNGDIIERGINSVRTLIYGVLNEPDAPYNYMMIGEYILIVVLAFMRKDLSYIWKLPLLGTMRCIPWLYLLISDRVPQRIWHPLYWVELLLLLAIIVKQLHMLHGDLTKWKSVCSIGLYGFFVIITFFRLSNVVEKVDVEVAHREKIYEPFELFNEYAEEHPENYYFLDVYSSVYFSEKAFKDIEIKQKNYDILGGWIAKSPLQREALETFSDGTGKISEMLLQESCFFVTEQDKNTDLVREFYRERDILLDFKRICGFGEDEHELVVYQITRENE